MSTIRPALPQTERARTQVPQHESPSASRRANLVADCAIGIVCVPAFTAFAFGIALLLLTGNAPGRHDLVSYWTAGRQLLHHANPYDNAAILRAELAAGFSPDAQVLLMRNPPWTLPIVLPLGLLGVRSASLAWTLLLLACFIASVRMIGTLLREKLSQPESQIRMLGCTFAPALLCILAGQSSLFALLGLVLFLGLHKTRPYLAGSALYLCALKPHLFLPFAAVLSLWIVATRSCRLLLGFLTTLSAAAAVATWFDPQVWTHYRQMMQTSGIAAEFIACPAVALRFALAPHAIWLQYLPAVLACAWAARYYARRGAAWDWVEHGSLLLLVSLLVSPYAWVTDQVILLPALSLGLLRATSRWPLRTFMLASALIEVQQLSGVTMHSAWVLWTAPFWLAWFLLVIRQEPLSFPKGIRFFGISP